MIEQTFARRSSKNLQDGRAKTCKMAEQKFARWPSKNLQDASKDLQDGRAKKCKMAEHPLIPHSQRSVWWSSR
jgi:hypothetical protein